jgi:drug/metabolite transporter (DMT)-like permease
MGLSFAGAALISLDEGQGLSLDPGAFLILLSAVCVSVYFVFQKPYLRKYGALAFTTYAIWAGTLLSLVYLPGLVAQAAVAPAGSTLTMVYLGVFPTAVGYITYAYAFSRMNASVAASFLYLVPVLAYLIAWLWIGETPTALSVLGGAITLCGVVLVNRRPRPR